MTDSSQTSSPTQHTTNKTDENPRPQRASNPRSQQLSGCRPKDLRPHSYRDRSVLSFIIYYLFYNCTFCITSICAKVKNIGSCTYTSPYVTSPFDRDNFTVSYHWALCSASNWGHRLKKLMIHKGQRTSYRVKVTVVCYSFFSQPQ